MKGPLKLKNLKNLNLPNKSPDFLLLLLNLILQLCMNLFYLGNCVLLKEMIHANVKVSFWIHILHFELVFSFLNFFFVFLINIFHEE